MRLTRLSGALAAPFFAAALVAMGAPPAHADDSLGVARLSWMQGNVAVQHTDGGQNVAGAVNAPLIDGDAMTTGSGARAEVQFDGTSALRLLDNTQVRFAQLDPSNRSIQLAEGTVDLDLFHNASALPVIDTPSVSVRAAGDGRYRVTVTNDGVSYITVRSGTADVLLPRGRQALRPGSTMVVSGRASNPSYSYIAAVGLDDFDRFNEERDSSLYAYAGADGISSSVAVGDLNAYGNWVNDPSYGNVWVPDQSSGWAPYRDGSWTWLAGYGYSWVGSEPWGWAPYHYGRWFYNAGYGGWCWYPSSVYTWSPALVGFFGFGDGGGFGFGLNFGNIGWVPLAPWESYYPGYGYGYGGTNIVNITNVYNYYGNAPYGGLTGISGRRFTQGDFRHNVAIGRNELRRVEGIHGALPVRPSAPVRRFTQSRALPTDLANRRFGQNVAYHPQFAEPTHVIRPSAPIAQIRGFGQATHVLTTHSLPATHAALLTHDSTQQRPAAPVERTAAPAHEVMPQAHVVTPIERTATPTHEVTAQAHAFAAPVPQTAAPQNDAWSRFNQARGTTTTYARPSGSVDTTQRAGATDGAPRTATYDAPRTNAVTPANGAWSRFDSQRGGYAQPSNPSPRASYDTRTNVPAPRAVNASPQQYSQPRSNAQPQYSQPRSYAQPQYSQPRSYAQPQYSQPRSYPQPQYSQPRSNPQPQYSQPRSNPQPQYSQPRSYAQPQYSQPRSSSPPARSSSSNGGSRGSSSSGSNHHPPH
jgi:hypothetical protein